MNMLLFSWFRNRESIYTVKLILKRKMSTNDVKLSSQSLENGEQIINHLVSQKKGTITHTHKHTGTHKIYFPFDKR